MIRGIFAEIMRAICFILFSGLFCKAQQWNQFLGPNGNGVIEGKIPESVQKNGPKVLWKAKLPFGGNATPSTYMVDGRQFVVISAGGGKSGRPRGGSLVAFALPDKEAD